MMYFTLYADIVNPVNGVTACPKGTVVSIGVLQSYAEMFGIKQIECQALLVDSWQEAIDVGIHNKNHLFATSLKG